MIKKGTLFFKNRKRHKIAGIGLVALDVVLGMAERMPPRVWAGGSCGNVLTILAFLGWDAYPISRLGNDVAASEIIRDFKRWNVETTFLLQQEDESTPIIVERININNKGLPIHRFEWVCPNCGAKLPKFKPVLAREVDCISERLPSTEIFYSDRVSRSSIELARISKQRGAFIILEPSGVKDKTMFLEYLELVDILKYSNDRLNAIGELTNKVNIPLEVETMGDKGLKYRLGVSDRSWTQLNAFEMKRVRDSAGAGDWCTAGLLHYLQYQGKLKELSRKAVEDALKFGQILGAMSCCYEGARGMMYNLTKKDFEIIAKDAFMGVNIDRLYELGEQDQIIQVLKRYCPRCINTVL